MAARTCHRTAICTVFVMLLAVGLLATACVPAPPGREPDMSLARVADSTQSGEDWSLMLEVPAGEHEKVFGDKADYEGYMEAATRVTADTTLVKSVDNRLAEATMTEILDAEHLSVWFEGPVAESYPVQATAGYIEITE